MPPMTTPADDPLLADGAPAHRLVEQLRSGAVPGLEAPGRWRSRLSAICKGARAAG